MADCIDAQITADIKTALETISVANGYNTEIGTVEEKRSIFIRNNETVTFTLVEKLPPEIEDDFQHTEDGKVKYLIYYFNGEDDEDPDNNPVQYTDRNVCADIQKALLIDRTRGNVAQNTHVMSFGHDFYFQNGMIDVPIMCTWVLVEVERLLDADNPYQIA